MTTRTQECCTRPDAARKRSSGKALPSKPASIAARKKVPGSMKKPPRNMALQSITERVQNTASTARLHVPGLFHYSLSVARRSRKAPIKTYVGKSRQNVPPQMNTKNQVDNSCDDAEGEDSVFFANKVPSMPIDKGIKEAGDGHSGMKEEWDETRLDTEVQLNSSYSCVHNRPLSCKLGAAGCIMNDDNFRLLSPTSGIVRRDGSCRQGMLMKQAGGLLKPWKPRYCVLKKSIFVYYKKQGDIKVQGALNFDFLLCSVEREDADKCPNFTYGLRRKGM